MRVAITMLFVLVLVANATPDPVQAQPAEITVENCTAFEITDLDLLCCYAFTLCIENHALPPIDTVQLTLNGAMQCVPPGAPDGWAASSGGPFTIEWEADPGDEIPAGIMLCGFRFSADSRTTDLTVALLAAGVPVFDANLNFTCGEDCTVPVEPGTWGRIKAVYAD